MSSKLPMSQGRRTPLTLNAQPKQQAQQGNRRPSTSAGTKAEQNKQQHQQQQHQIKEDKKETVDMGANKTNSQLEAKEVQNTVALNNGSDVVVGNGNNVANGNNKTAVANAAIVSQEPLHEKKETRHRAVKQQQQSQQSTKNDGQHVMKSTVAKHGSEPIAKTAPATSPSQRKQQIQQQQHKQEQQQQQQKEEQQQQQNQKQEQQQQQQKQKQEQQQHKQKQQHQQVVAEAKVSPPPTAPIQKPVEEKAAITQHQKPQIENKSSSNALVVDETSSNQIENAPVVATKSAAEKSEAEASGPSVTDVKHVDVQSKDEAKKNNLEQSAKAATPTKPVEIKAVSSPKSDVTKINKTSPVLKQTVTSCIDADDNGDVVAMQVSPIKKSDKQLMAPPAIVNENPNATSTPGKSIRTFDIQTPEPRANGEPIRNLTISGRRSIRPISEWTPSRFENNPEFRGSYRRIKTELDNSMDTNTSLNVTVGSELDNNSSWFSFRSRKRERTPTNIESVKEAMLSPPKRARFGIFSVISSPLTALRSRFSKTSITNNGGEKEAPENGEETEVDNVPLTDNVQEESKVENIFPEAEENEDNSKSSQQAEIAVEEEVSATASNEKMSDLMEDDIEDFSITQTSLVKQGSSNNVASKKSCNIM